MGTPTFPDNLVGTWGIRCRACRSLTVPARIVASEGSCLTITQRPGGVADRTRLPRTEDRLRPGPIRRPLLERLAPPRHPSPPPRNSSSLDSAGREKHRAGLSLYAVPREIQYLLAIWLGFCPLCHQLVPT